MKIFKFNASILLEVNSQLQINLKYNCKKEKNTYTHKIDIF